MKIKVGSHKPQTENLEFLKSAHVAGLYAWVLIIQGYPPKNPMEFKSVLGDDHSIAAILCR